MTGTYPFRSRFKSFANPGAQTAELALNQGNFRLIPLLDLASASADCTKHSRMSFIVTRVCCSFLSSFSPSRTFSTGKQRAFLQELVIHFQP